MNTMKFLLSMFIGVIALFTVQAQKPINVLDTIKYQGNPPQFYGGEKVKKEFLHQNFVYPSEARDGGIEGEVILRFIVEKNGELTEFQLVKNPGGGLGEELMRVYKLMPPWVPGSLEDRIQRVPVTETLNIRLRESDRESVPPKIDRKTLMRINFRGR